MNLQSVVANALIFNAERLKALSRIRPRRSLIVWLSLGLLAPYVSHADWQAEQIADALRAAPPSVTQNAKIYAWKENGERVLVRNGDGPYTCVASGSYSLRVGKPPLPYPDSFCADQNAWAFIEAFWTEPDPMNPSKPLPQAPGMVWMLAGMNVVQGKVAYGKGKAAMIQTGQTVSDPEQQIINMTPHIMILPLPLRPEKAQLSGSYDPNQPLAMWVMAPHTPIAHLHVHFPETVHQELMRIGTNEKE